MPPVSEGQTTSPTYGTSIVRVLLTHSPEVDLPLSSLLQRRTDEPVTTRGECGGADI